MPETTSLFQDGGRMSALISLEAADNAPIVQLKESLCALLTGGPTMMDAQGNKLCQRDGAGKIVAKGDACLSTLGAATADCADAVFFNADFAASGVDVSN